ncbi:nuclear transport factor 2 family protein [Streptomyces sp. NPDC007875]|uniref:nuclear transport factor 2 family protein n=1 Tax=Streptomyces sp. NPDC007875 TaxID=3364783 RepID=UPI003678061A
MRGTGGHRARSAQPGQGGQAVSTGCAYDNHFVSVITIKDRKITHWRDCLDPAAVFDAIGRPAHPE